MELRGTSRKIALGIFAVLVLILGVVAILIGIRLQEQTAPPTTRAFAFGDGFVQNLCGSPLQRDWAEHDAAGCEGCEAGGTCGGESVKIYTCTRSSELTYQGTSPQCTFNEQDLGDTTINFGDYFEDSCEAVQIDVFDAGGTLTDYIVWIGNSFGNCPTVPEPVCGNDTVESGEACDDGNTVSGDGCSATCETETSSAVCGDGDIEGTEACDDGNTTAGDGCSATCTIETTTPVCGNDSIESGEACDDGNTVSGDGCSATCTVEQAASCGDGTIDSGEQCDPGSTPTGCASQLSCNPTSCVCEATTTAVAQCGDACTNNADCPTDHLCSSTTSTCVLAACVGNTACTNNSCTLPAITDATLPDTALISEETDLLLLGMALIIGGFILVRFQLLDRSFSFVTSGVSASTRSIRDFVSVESSKQDRINKSRNKFEQEMERKIEKRQGERTK